MCRLRKPKIVTNDQIRDVRCVSVCVVPLSPVRSLLRVQYTHTVVDNFLLSFHSRFLFCSVLSPFFLLRRERARALFAKLSSLCHVHHASACALLSPGGADQKRELFSIQRVTY